MQYQKKGCWVLWGGKGCRIEGCDKGLGLWDKGLGRIFLLGGGGGVYEKGKQSADIMRAFSEGQDAKQQD